MYVIRPFCFAIFFLPRFENLWCRTIISAWLTVFTYLWMNILTTLRVILIKWKINIYIFYFLLSTVIQKFLQFFLMWESNWKQLEVNTINDNGKGSKICWGLSRSVRESYFIWFLESSWIKPVVHVSKFKFFDSFLELLTKFCPQYSVLIDQLFS